MDRFNENVELLCAKRGIRKKEVIAAVGISKASFYAKLAGTRPWFLEEAVKVAQFLGVNLDELV